MNIEATTTTTTTRVPGRNLFVVIGINRYLQWTNLHNAAFDALGVAGAFQKLGFEPAAVLIDQEASSQAMRNLTFNTLANLGPEDNLVLFYAGHGHAVTHQGAYVAKRSYLIPCDAEANPARANWIELSSWLSDIAILPPRHILVILDTQGITIDPILTWRDIGTWKDIGISTLESRRSRRIITSTLEGESATDGGPIAGHSLFTGIFIEALTHGLLASGVSVVTGSELALYVQRRVREHPIARQTPDFGTFALDERGEMLISLTHIDITENVELSSDIAFNPDSESASSHDGLVSGPSSPLNEAKLIVVGNEAVGKTSLIRFLIEGKSRNHNEGRTPGTSIHEKIKISAWSVRNSQARINVWDFGGQEIMRGTHRYFLTDRSLYLLVLEDRREDDRSVYEWLEIIAQRGGASPVIVVINKSDGDTQHRQLDEVGLQRAYPVIAGFARTSCNSGSVGETSIAHLREMIVETIDRSPRLQYVREPIPRSWFRIKDAIAENARSQSVLSMSDFQRLCENGDSEENEDRIIELDEQRKLLALLNDLGIVVTLGFLDEAPAVRREMAILDPNWLTGAIYALINSRTVREQGGQLRRDQLIEILDPATHPTQWHELLLSMMQEPALGLCLPIIDVVPRYLLPDALPTNEPDLDWPSQSLRFRFKIRPLPADFIPRFIATAHHSLTSKPTLWKMGVVLGIEGCRVLVRGEPAEDRVEVYVTGKSRQRTALGVVRSFFDEVHRYYVKLNIEPRVPLPEQSNIDVGYEHLLALEQSDGLDCSFLPERAARKYTVRELLEGVRDANITSTPTAASVAYNSIRISEIESTDHNSQKKDDHHDEIDFGILTIREDENSAILRRFEKVKKQTGRLHYRIRRLPLTNGNEYKIAVLRCLEQGNTDAQAAAHALIEDLAPRFLLVVGIAGGVPSDDFSLGDVVVSSRIADFSVEAVTRDKGTEYALAGGPLHPTAASIAGDIPSMIADEELVDWNSTEAISRPRPVVSTAEDRFYGDADWRATTREKILYRFEGSRESTPRAIVGTIASSDRLIKDDETMSVWTKIARQIRAVEMESAGIYKATHGRIPFLAIRGISDVVGYRRHPDWITYACETAAAFTRAFLLTQPIPPFHKR